MPYQLTLEGRPLAIYPVRGKVPCCEGGYKAAVSDPQQIHDLFLRYRNAGIAVATGAVNDLDIVDIDPRHGGNKFFEENRHRIPLTRTHTTPGGGRHLLFHHANGLRCSDSRIAPGVDVKADGGGVVWHPARFYPVHDAPVAEWPAWLLELAMGAKPKRDRSAISIFGLGSSSGLAQSSGEIPKPLYLKILASIPGNPRHQRWIRGILRPLVEKREGRNAALNRAAFDLRQPIADGVITRDAAEQLLMMAAKLNGYHAKDGEGAVTDTIQSGLGPSDRPPEDSRSVEKEAGG
jgi:hypothetical protein